MLLLSLLLASTRFWSLVGASNHEEKVIAQEGVQVPNVHQYMGNLSEAALFHPKGWHAPNICEGRWCIYSNREVGDGRGMALITNHDNFQKVRRLESVMRKVVGTLPPGTPDVPFEERQVEGAAPGKFELVAKAPLKRGAKLMELLPVLLAHKLFINETTPEAQDRLLEAALTLLPEKTRQLVRDGVARSRHPEARHSIRRTLLTHPLETGTGATHWDGPDHGRHYALYPEILAAAHECRPNAAFYIDINHVLHVNVARKIEPPADGGEPISISYLNPQLPREKRQEAGRLIWGKPCSCDHCTSGGDLNAVRARDVRHKEIEAIEKELKDMDSTRVTTGMLQHYLELLERDRSQSRMAEAYELVAYNYAYLGYEKRARKYGGLAVQAAAIEQGADSNDVTALRIFTNSVKEHYSWQRKVKKKEHGGGK